MVELAPRLLEAAYALLPPVMDSTAASALLVAIGWQESRWRRRRQVQGPARGFLQFERAGVRAVLTHARSRAWGLSALGVLRYPTSPLDAAVEAAYAAVEHNDLLCLVFGRLLLWTLPQDLPTSEQRDDGWAQYLAAWRPGRPRRETWAEAWRIGWEWAP